MRTRKKRFVRLKPKPAMKRAVALDIAQRAFRRGGHVHPEIRDEILATQSVDPKLSGIEMVCAGWTAEEKIAFYRDGTVPARYRT